MKKCSHSSSIKEEDQDFNTKLKQNRNSFSFYKVGIRKWYKNAHKQKKTTLLFASNYLQLNLFYSIIQL